MSPPSRRSHFIGLTSTSVLSEDDFSGQRFSSIHDKRTTDPETNLNLKCRFSCTKTAAVSEVNSKHTVNRKYNISFL
jgi:hypothetical protein